MSNASRSNSSTSLMGFSVHQPSIGSPLQFFPAMGSKQLDEMIETYVPGDAPIASKRATVSMEFFEHSMATGELFKFFMVYPSLGSITDSPSGSMLDSGYGSSFTSPVMSESQWAHAGSAPLPHSESGTGKPSARRTALSNDFSHLPGMKIITKDGKDVTNMTSRGCKTKEQRDHAHLMRIIKACDSCRRKKVRCDPSHKRSAGSSSAARISKKAKKTAASTIPSSAPPPQQALAPSVDFSHAPPFNTPDESLSLSFDSAMSDSSLDLMMDWNQFIQFDEEPTEAIPFDYDDFFHNPQGLLSPTSYNSFSPSQPITPAKTLGAESMGAGTVEGETQAPLPPYLNPGGEAGSNYTDFNLYSPGSSTGLEDDPSLSNEVAAMPLPDYFKYSDHQRLADGRGQETPIDEHGNFDTHLAVSPNAPCHSSLFALEQSMSPASLSTVPYDENVSHTVYDNSAQIKRGPEWYVPVSSSGQSPVPPAESDEPGTQPRGVSSPAEADVWETGVNRSLAQPNVAYLETCVEQKGSHPRSPPTEFRIIRSTMTDQQIQQRSAPMLTSGAGIWSTTSGALAAPAPRAAEPHPGSRSPQKPNWQVQSKPTRNETWLPRLPVFDSYGTDGTSSSLVSSSQPRFRTRPLIRPAERTIAIYTESDIDGLVSRQKGVAVNSSIDDVAARALSTITQNGLLGGRVSYISSTEINNDVLLSGALVSALAMTALHVLPALLAIGVVFRWLFFSNGAEKFEAMPVLADSLSVTFASLMLQQRSTRHMDTLDPPARPLSFLRRLPFVVTNNTGSKYPQLSWSFSRIHCNFEKKYNFRASGKVEGMRSLRRIASLV